MPTATSTLATIMTSIVNTTVDLATTVFEDYWPYVLIFAIIGAMIGAFARFAKLGTGSHK